MAFPRTALLSYSLGTGHKKAAETLAVELGLLGHKCEHRQLEEWVPWDYYLLFRRGFLFLTLKAPSVWGALYRSPFFAKRRVLAFPAMASRAVMCFEKEGFGEADLVVVTQYNAMEIAADWKRATRRDLKLAVVITDYDIYPLWARPEVDLYLVPHGDLKALLVARGVPESRVVATGIPIDPVFESPRRDGASREALGLREDSPVAMVFGGGGGWGPMEAAVKACMGAEGWQILAVCGHNEKLRRKLERLARTKPGRLRVLGYRHDVPQIMSASDVVFTKGGGLSLTEALHSGARTIVLNSLPGQELANLKFMESRGWIEVCEDVSQLGRLLRRPALGQRGRRELPSSPAKAGALALDALVRQTSP